MIVRQFHLRRNSKRAIRRPRSENQQTSVREHEPMRTFRRWLIMTGLLVIALMLWLPALSPWPFQRRRYSPEAEAISEIESLSAALRSFRIQFKVYPPSRLTLHESGQARAKGPQAGRPFDGSGLTSTLIVIATLTVTAIPTIPSTSLVLSASSFSSAVLGTKPANSLDSPTTQQTRSTRQRRNESAH